jgi:thiamine biosynthesis lipoprotein
MPVQYWRTVSVTAPMSVMAGCTSTVAMLMQAQGLAFLESTGFDFFAMDHQGHVHTKT